MSNDRTYNVRIDRWLQNTCLRGMTFYCAIRKWKKYYWCIVRSQEQMIGDCLGEPLKLSIHNYVCVPDSVTAILVGPQIKKQRSRFLCNCNGEFFLKLNTNVG